MREFKQNPAATLNTEASPACLVCQKPIVDSQWFCRVLQKNGAPDFQTKRILLCSPGCALRYFEDSQPGGNSFEPNYNGYEHSRQVAASLKPSNARSARNSREKQ